MELVDLSVRELIKRMRCGQTSSVEICQAFFRRIHEASAINAVVHLDQDQVLSQARKADSAIGREDLAPLLGIPFSVKDSLAVEGWPWRSGSYAREHVIAEKDATAVARLRELGAIPLCKTATPEYTWSAQTHSQIHGRTHNPYDLERSPGGSSGGEAALHATHGAPFGLGTDGFTSIRVPAHFCGSAGLRPTAGVVSEAGTWPLTKQTGMYDISTTGPMGRYAEDLDLILNAIAGPDVDDPFVHPLLPQDHPPSINSLKVGVLPNLLGHTEGTSIAIQHVVDELLLRGANVFEIEPWSTDEATTLAFALMAPDGGVRARRNLHAAQDRHTKEFKDLLQSLELGRLTIDQYLLTLDSLTDFRRRIRRSISKVDIAIVPVASGAAPLHDRLPGDDLEAYSVTGFSHSFAIALAGVPSAVIPVVMENSLPVGVQIVGSIHKDYHVLKIATIIQEFSKAQILPPTAWMS